MSGLMVELATWLIPALVAVALCRNPGPADLGWQLQIGRFMIKEGPFLHEKLVVTHLGEALVPNAWLAQIVYARLFDWVGLRGLRAADAMLWIAGPLLAAIPARLRSAKPLPTFYALVIGFAVAMPSAGIRPQSFASLCFGLTLMMIQMAKPRRTMLLPGLLLFVVWQNLHPSVPLAALTIGTIAAVQWARHLAGQADRPVAFTVLALAASAAIFATPAGTAILAFARYNATASIAFGATEWFPLWHPYHRAALLSVLASAAIVLLVVVQQRKTIPVCELVPALITFAMALTAARFVLFYAIAIVPLLTRLDIGSVQTFRIGLRRIVAGHAVAALLVIGVAMSMPVRPDSAGGREIFAALTRRLHGGTVFCDPAFGGSFTLDGYPNWKVSFDGRFYLYRPEEIARLHRSYWDGSVLTEIERIYHPAAYALNASHSAALVHELTGHPESWLRVYDNGVSMLFVRIAPPTAR